MLFYTAYLGLETILKSGPYLSKDSIRVCTVLKSQIFLNHWVKPSSISTQSKSQASQVPKVNFSKG